MSSTAKQIAANQANATKSTGPKSAAGKQAVKVNAVRHGLTGRTVVLPSDDLDLYKTHVKTLTAHLKPEGPEEIQLASLIADDYWRLQRIHSIEDGIFAMQFAENEILATHPAADATLNQATAYLQHSKELERLTLYEQRIHRNIKASTARLESLQQARRAAQATTPIVSASDPHTRAKTMAAKGAAPDLSSRYPTQGSALVNGFEFSTTCQPPQPAAKTTLPTAPKPKTKAA